MKKWKKLLHSLLACLVIFSAALLFIGSPGIREVQAATAPATPKMVSVKPSGTKKIIIKWNASANAQGYRIYRRTGNSTTWQALAQVKGRTTVSYADSKTTAGRKYTYTVRAFRKSGSKTLWSSYDKKGLYTISGLNYLKLSKTKLSMETGKSYKLTLKGTSLTPVWKSSNTAIASIAKDGRIRAIKPGTVKITATLAGKPFTCTVTVKLSAAEQAYGSYYTKLKNYLNQYGRTDKLGNRFIYDNYSDASTQLAIYITYMKKEDTFDFALETYVKEQDTFVSVDVLFNCLKNTKADVEEIWAIGNDAVRLHSSFYTDWYDSDPRLIFYDDANDFVDNEISNTANQFLDAAMIGAKELLMEKAGISITDLGFTNFW